MIRRLHAGLSPRRCASMVWGALVCWSLLLPSGAAAKAFLMRVPVPISGNADEVIRRGIRQLMSEAPSVENLSLLILEFWPAGDEGSGSSQFERCLALARYLSGPDLRGFRTVAFLPRTVTGHAVLPILACDEIVMHPSAELGAAGADEKTLSPTIRSFYREIADMRRTIPPAVALGMLDPQLTVLRAKTPAGNRYLLQEELEALQRETTVQELETIVRQGDLARFSGTELRVVHGFVSYLAADRRELAAKLEVPLSELQPNPALGSGWKAVRVNLAGPINAVAADRFVRSVQDAIRREGANLICVWCDSPGGAPAESLKAASYLAALDASRVRTIAYISQEARGDAALIALGCDQIVMEPTAILGGPGAYEPTVSEIEDLRIAVKKLCEEKSRRWSLPLALVDPELSVFQWRLEGTDVREALSDTEWQQLADPERWQRGEEVTQPGLPLRLTAEQSVAFGLAHLVVADFASFKEQFDLGAELQLVEPSWADEFIAFLAQPHVAGTLLFFGGFALMVELTSPGLGAGALVSAVCFVIFFWSQFLHGTADWLEIILFLLGIVFLVLEVFVLPGFGIFGLGGLGLIVVSLILASQTFVIPKNEYQWQTARGSLLTLVGAGTGIVLGLVTLRKYLKQAPLLGRVILAPPEGESLEELERRESLVDYEGLVGQTGIAATQLTPSGKALFGDRLVDVISDGQVISKGARIHVDQVLGNRVIVSVRSSE